jgi:signal transduction histidine kinase
MLTVEQALEHVRLIEKGRELSRRAQRAEKLAAVGTLAAGLSHEIKNPLNAAALQLTVLERRLKRLPNVAPDLFEPLVVVQAEIKRLAAFLDEFLQFARPRDLQRAPTDVAAIAREVTEFLLPQATAAHLTLSLETQPVPSLNADPARIRQSLVNLVLNAIQATPAGGTISVVTGVEEAHVCICVDDSGPGVAEPLRDRIFEPFFTTKDAGTGLGLPLVHSIIQQHGGTIALETSPAGGARFHLRLPIHAR